MERSGAGPGERVCAALHVNRQTERSRGARRISSKRQRLNCSERKARSESSNAPVNSTSRPLIGGRGGGRGEAGAHLAGKVVDRLLERADAPGQLAQLGAVGGGRGGAGCR